MITFKQFLKEADTLDLSSMPAPQQTPPQAGGAAAPTQPQSSGNKMKGTLTDNEKRVLALLSVNQLKSAPGRAREMMSGEQNLVTAVKALKKNFNAVDVTPDGITINQTGINLATNQGIVDPNSGELSDLGNKLVTTLPNGTINPKTKDLAGGGGAPQMPPPAAGGLPPI